MTHDGYFLAADRGGGIKKNHIDVFVGVLTESPSEFERGPRSGTREQPGKGSPKGHCMLEFVRR